MVGSQGHVRNLLITFVPVVSHSNNVSNNEIMTIMNIEMVTYPLVKKCIANQFWGAMLYWW